MIITFLNNTREQKTRRPTWQAAEVAVPRKGSARSQVIRVWPERRRCPNTRRPPTGWRACSTAVAERWTPAAVSPTRRTSAARQTGTRHVGGASRCGATGVGRWGREARRETALRRACGAYRTMTQRELDSAILQYAYRVLAVLVVPKYS